MRTVRDFKYGHAFSGHTRANDWWTGRRCNDRLYGYSFIHSSDGNSCNRIYTLSWDATDACGNHSATVSQLITVRDTQPPTIGAAGDNATIECTAAPTFTPPTATDACSGAMVNCISTTTSSGSCPGSIS